MPDSRLVDPLGREITLAEYTWDRHILVNHPDMDGGKEYVEETIVKPLSIWRSGKDENVRIYYGSGPNENLLVAVKADIVKGIVLTSHLAKKTSGAEQEWP